MKKLVLFLAVAFSVSLFSCGGSDKKAEAVDTLDAVVEETTVEVAVPDSCCGDSACVDSCAAEATCEAQA